jgi:hypothetical protein
VETRTVSEAPKPWATAVVAPGSRSTGFTSYAPTAMSGPDVIVSTTRPDSGSSLSVNEATPEALMPWMK